MANTANDITGLLLDYEKDLKLIEEREQVKNCSIPVVIKSCETCSKLSDCKIVQSCKERGNTHCAYFEHVL